MFMEKKPSTSLHPCLAQKSQHSACKDCKFNEEIYCEEIRKLLLITINNTIKPFEWKLNDQDKEDILSIIFAKILEKFAPDNFGKFKYSISTWAKGELFSFLRKKFRVGTITYSVKNPPNNIEDLCTNKFADFFYWKPDEKKLQLIKYPLTPEMVRIAQQYADFSQQKDEEKKKNEWRILIDRFHRNSKTLEIDPSVDDPGVKTPKGGKKIKIKLPNELTQMERVLSESKDRSALQCQKIFRTMIETDCDFHNTATELNLSEQQQVKDLLKKCRKIFRKTLITILGQMNCDEAIKCKDLFRKLEDYKSTLPPKQRKAVTVVDLYERNNDLPQHSIGRKLHQCRMIIIRWLEEKNV
jgi:hypothetical protein